VLRSISSGKTFTAEELISGNTAIMKKALEGVR